MQWGRKRNQSIAHTKSAETPVLPRTAYAVITTGALICMIFFGKAVSKPPSDAVYPPEKAAAAGEAFLLDHTSLAAVLGLDVYFPEESVAVGTFGEPIERWTFSQYLRDAFRAFLFGERR